MSLASSKTTSLQSYTMLVYRKPLHPEFFGIEGRRRIDQDDFEFEGWIFPGGQVARFQTGSVTICEVVTDQVENLPEHLQDLREVDIFSGDPERIYLNVQGNLSCLEMGRVSLQLVMVPWSKRYGNRCSFKRPRTWLSFSP